MKEYLAKRYKDFLADRILKCIMNFFNNGFIVNLDFANYCDAVENFINQDEAALKKFVYRCIDANSSQKLSENDLFQIMKATSPAINLHLNFSDFMHAMNFMKGGFASKLVLNRAIATTVFQKPQIKPRGIPIDTIRV
jgi:hypothetical protein